MSKTNELLRTVPDYLSPQIRTITIDLTNSIMAGSNVLSTDPEGYVIDNDDFTW